MLTKISIKNFKLFETAEIPLGNGFVFIGPNNGGKTSALQALALWHVGLQKLIERHQLKNKSKIPAKRAGVTINRLDLISLPVSQMDLIWFNRRFRKKVNQNVRIDLIVEGVSNGKEWKCGLEFDYSSLEAVYCRPLRTGSGNKPNLMEIPPEAIDIKLAFLPPMSGLSTEEPLIREGRINVLIGEGRTAEVLRNLCYRVYSQESNKNWQSLVGHINDLFGITLNEPQYLLSRGTVAMDYTDKDGQTKLDLPSSGRGMQQVLLLLSHLYDNASNTVFLLDEPDAHLEIFRQRQIYNLLNKVAEGQNSQIISASHSEILLTEAAESGSVVAFVGKPHILGKSNRSKLQKSLTEIGYEYYYGAERKGWILYLEGATDLRILQAFAERLEHPARDALQVPLVKYIGNIPNNARNHFHCLKEAKDNLQGFLLLDNTDKGLRNADNLSEFMWSKNEIENYLCDYEAIISFVTHGYDVGDIFGNVEITECTNQLQKEIDKLKEASETLGKPKPFSDSIKASDEFLVPLFKNLSASFRKSLFLKKKDFYKLVEFIPSGKIDGEVEEVLNKIVEVADAATP